MSRPFGVYVHVPFCARACPYCDFDFAVQARPDGAEFVRALERELASRDDARIGEAPRTVYVGGGTPSVLDADSLRSVLAFIAERWDVSGCQEWTVELNPEHVDAPRLAALRDAGVDRVSLGVQSFDGAGLRQLGRAHTPRQALDAAAEAMAEGLRVSVDLIVGWPGQDEVGLAQELDALVALQCEHVSIYALTIEPGTPWERLAERGVRRLPQVSMSATLLEHTERRLERAGFAHYEVASYARGGRIAVHNAGYWDGVDYVGVGPSAASASFDTAAVRRRTNARGEAWWSGAGPSQERVADEDYAREALWLALRRLSGVEIEPFLARVDRGTTWLQERIRRPVDRGNLALQGGVLRVAPGRWLHHDDIAVDVL